MASFRPRTSYSQQIPVEVRRIFVKHSYDEQTIAMQQSKLAKIASVTTDVDKGVWVHVRNLLDLFNKNLSVEEMKEIADHLAKGDVRTEDPVEIHDGSDIHHDDRRRAWRHCQPTLMTGWAGKSGTIIGKSEAMARFCITAKWKRWIGNSCTYLATQATNHEAQHSTVQQYCDI